MKIETVQGMLANLPCNITSGTYQVLNNILFFTFIIYKNVIIIIYSNDQAERHNLRSWSLLIHSPFLFPLFLGGKRITKVVVIRHTFLLDLQLWITKCTFCRVMLLSFLFFLRKESGRLKPIKDSTKCSINFISISKNFSIFPCLQRYVVLLERLDFVPDMPNDKIQLVLWYKVKVILIIWFYHLSYLFINLLILMIMNDLSSYL